MEIPATVPEWTCPESWMKALDAAAREAAQGRDSLPLPEGEKGFIASVTIRVLLDVAAIDAAAADRLTGRHVLTSHATVAARLSTKAPHPISERTVRRARTLIERLGFARTIQRGRYLTTAEREAADAAHKGSVQRRMASERALMIPAPKVPQQILGHLPRRGDFKGLLTSEGRSSKPASAGFGVGAMRPSNNKPKRRRILYTPSPAMGRLVEHYTPRRRALMACHPASVARTLHLCGIDPEQWTARDLAEALDNQRVQTGHDWIPTSQQRDPLALLAWEVRHMLATITETPGARRAREAAAYAAEQAAHRAAKAASDAAVASTSVVSASIAAIKANVRPTRIRHEDRLPYMPTR